MPFKLNPITGKLDLVVKSIADLSTKDHDLLDGLDDDDHAQYLLIDGSRAMTGNLLFGSSAKIIQNTSDGSDNRTLSFCAGGDITQGRGSYMILYGNDYASAGLKGKLTIAAGNTYASGVDGAIEFRTGDNNVRLTISYGGNLTIAQDLIVDGGDIGITADPDLMTLAANSLVINGSLLLQHDTQRSLGIGGDDTHYGYLAWYKATGNTRGAYMGYGTPGTYLDLVLEDSNYFKITAPTVRLTGDLYVDGGNIGITADPDLLGLANAALTINGTLGLLNGTTINEFSTDDTLGGDSDDAVPTEQAVKAYVDGHGASLTSYDTGWINRSDWTNVHLGSDDTKNADSNVIHSLNAPLSDLLVKILISTDGTDNNSFDVMLNQGATNSDFGINIDQVDTNTLLIQTGNRGLLRIDTNGITQTITTSDWYYKIKVYKLT